MVDKVSKENVSYKSTPYRFEAGTPNIAGVIAFKECIKYIEKLKIKNIHEHVLNLRNYIIEKIKDLNDLDIYNIKATGPTILLNVNGVHPHDIASFLDSRNICVRAGYHRAMLIANTLNITSSLRISISIYNDYRDCDKLIEALKDAINFFK